jgi:hypothetical protein
MGIVLSVVGLKINFFQHLERKCQQWFDRGVKDGFSGIFTKGDPKTSPGYFLPGFSEESAILAGIVFF